MTVSCIHGVLGRRVISACPYCTNNIVGAKDIANMIIVKQCRTIYL